MKCGGFFVATHHETALYTSEAQALSVTHARICLPQSRAKECGK